MKFTNLPAIASPLPGGIYAGVQFDPADQQLYAVVLAASKPESRLTWKDAQAWAKGLEIEGLSDFRVPNRQESLLLLHTLPDQFEKAWHWTSTQPSVDAQYAWMQHFHDGLQSYYDKSYEGRVRAVRLIHLTT